MFRNTTDTRVRRSAKKLRDTRRQHITIICAALSTANGSAFVPSARLRAQHSSLSSPRAPQVDYRTSRRQAATESAMSDLAVIARNARPMAKVQSPSNQYTQFYKEGVLVGIERTSSNSRRISGEIFVDKPIDNIWEILTDYDRLSTHVPNLVESTVTNAGSSVVGEKPRVYQRGAQRIFGFEFGADVTLDMTERVHQGEQDSKIYSVDFECVDSLFFSQFDGSWVLEACADAKTLVRYIVDVRPKGAVPVAALEWRIKEDVPVNILAVAKAAKAAGAGPREEAEPEISQARPPQAPTSRYERPPTRATPPPPQQSMQNPLRKFNDQSTQLFKKTAKAFLPTAVYSTARQAIHAINDANPISRREEAPPKAAGPASEDEERLQEVVVDWYEDETMATYL